MRPFEFAMVLNLFHFSMQPHEAGCLRESKSVHAALLNLVMTTGIVLNINERPIPA